MPDSPFCQNCLRAGQLNNTYKVSGTPSFRCGSCNHMFSRENFSEEELLWRDDYPKWLSFMKPRLKSSDEINKELKRIEGLSVK